jgi:hypothetical protein
MPTDSRTKVFGSPEQVSTELTTQGLDVYYSVCLRRGSISGPHSIRFQTERFAGAQSRALTGCVVEIAPGEAPSFHSSHNRGHARVIRGAALGSVGETYRCQRIVDFNAGTKTVDASLLYLRSEAACLRRAFWGEVSLTAGW